MKLVSVVVLAYRSADTIIETLESIKKQTYPQIELIVTDDCSPDNTVEVVESWMRDNKGCLSDMKLVTTKKNTGLCMFSEQNHNIYYNMPVFQERMDYYHVL